MGTETKIKISNIITQFSLKNVGKVFRLRTISMAMRTISMVMSMSRSMPRIRTGSVLRVRSTVCPG